VLFGFAGCAVAGRAPPCDDATSAGGVLITAITGLR
jgi:hypothetical protein